MEECDKSRDALDIEFEDSICLVEPKLRPSPKKIVDFHCDDRPFHDLGRRRQSGQRSNAIECRKRDVRRPLRYAVDVEGDWLGSRLCPEAGVGSAVGKWGDSVDC